MSEKFTEEQYQEIVKITFYVNTTELKKLISKANKQTNELKKTILEIEKYEIRVRVPE